LQEGIDGEITKPFNLKNSSEYKNLKESIDNELNLTKKYNSSTEDITHKLEVMNPLRLLNGYVLPEKKHMNGYPRARPLYKTNYMGFVKNPGYCDIVDMYNLYHPENVYDHMNFIVDYISSSLVRKGVVK